MAKRVYREFLRLFWSWSKSCKSCKSLRHARVYVSRCQEADLPALRLRQAGLEEMELKDLEVLCYGWPRRHEREDREDMSKGRFHFFPYRTDERFNAAMYRCRHLHRSLAKGGKLRERDEFFLDYLLKLYPATLTDGCVADHVRILRLVNKLNSERTSRL